MRSLLLILLLPAVALADPKVNISWNGCAATSPPQNLTLADGPTPTIVVTGHGFTQAVRGIQIFLRVSHRAYWGLPDSWRYDAAGCSAGGFTASYASAGCPALVGSNPVSISSFEFDGTRGVAKIAYAFDAWTPDPNTTYTLAQFTFDKSNAFRGLGTKADSCGCGEREEALELIYATWLTASTVETPFALESEFVSWEDPDHSAYCATDCLPPTPDHPDPCSVEQPTPAAERSWGSVKSQYR